MPLYRLDATDTRAHRFHVTCTVESPAPRQRVSLPAWIPGSYLVREFARHASGLRARQRDRDLAVHQLDKATWQIDAAADAPLVLDYDVYAFDTSVRAAWLDAQRGFFNGTSVFLRVESAEGEPHRVELRALPDGWRVATALSPEEIDGEGRGRYGARDYDELVDHPVELGRFWRGEFLAAGVPHAFVVAGALPDFDGDRLLADAARICEAQIRFWHGGEPAKPPFERYLFLLNAVDEGHGGLEHRASTALVAARRDLPKRGLAKEPAELPDGYVGLLGLVSHEYFHTWNVKRLKPREFARYDYTRENYTRLLWFFEGFTSYYDDLFLVRTKLIDDARYLKLVARTITAVAATPGRRVQTLADASFDAWVKYYRADENTPNATVSYYAKGALVALAFDLTLRREGAGTLDRVLQRLWAASDGGPIDEADIASALETVGARSYAPELAAWVHGTDELPLQTLLQEVGVEWQATPPTVAQRLGLRVTESALTGVKATHVLRGGAAEAAGVSAGDELLALDSWRLRRLDDAARIAESGQGVALLVSRDQRVLTLDLAWPDDAAAGAGAVNLKRAAQPTPEAKARGEAWLSG
ncbi:MAG TPA: peptidase M61 [Caldimonas sp.]|nr:peptidase M61 [Caldimonas sp.]